jgi:hypothetical protein
VTPEAQSTVCHATKNCLLDWISALGGWAGFGAASVALALTRKQIAQQQRQIDFQLGDAGPTFYIQPSNDPSFNTNLIVCIKNWNRRPLILEQILCSSSFELSVSHVILDEKKRDGFKNWQGRLLGSTLPGRQDDGRAPQAEIHINLIKKEGFRSTNTDNNGWEMWPVRIRLICHLLDNPPQAVTFDRETTVFAC